MQCSMSGENNDDTTNINAVLEEEGILVLSASSSALTFPEQVYDMVATEAFQPHNEVILWEDEGNHFAVRRGSEELSSILERHLGSEYNTKRVLQDGIKCLCIVDSKHGFLAFYSDGDIEHFESRLLKYGWEKRTALVR